MASLPYEIAKLIKEPGNRLCADCQAPLTTPPNTYASLRYGVWLCSSCADIHATELPSANILKKAQEDWSAGEIKVMQDAKSNLAVNKILERYVPSGWEKISAISSVDEKKHWIKAKYFSHYFTVPQTSVDGLNKIEKTNRKKRIIADTTLPTRIVDYFLILGPGKAKLTPEGNPPPDSTPSSPQKKIDNLEQVEFKVDIIDSYPDKKNHYHDTPIPELVGPMIFPSGLTLSRNERAPFSFSFVLTDINRVKLYGMTLIIYEIMDPDVLCYLLGSKYTAHDIKRLTSGMVYYAPKALTILSHYGFFQLFSKFLQQIYHVSLSSSPLPLERYIVNFMKELPLPPPGRTEILFSLPQIQLSITRPPPNQLPMVDFSFRPVFTCLSVDNILTVFTCLCQEMTVCFTSRNIALLTPVQEAFLSFMFPFVWQGCYVPILPVNMIEMLDAPVPLLCGMNQADLEKMMEEEDIALANVIFVNLDNDSVVYGIGEENPLDEPKRPILPLPKSKVGKLKSKLEEFGGIIYHTDMVQVMKAGHPFSNNEHLVPMKNFIFEQGVISTTAQHHRSSFFSSAKAMTKSQFKLGIRKTLNNNAAANIANGSNASTSPNHPRVSNAGIAASGGKYQAIAESEALPFKHPAACTLVTSSNARQNTSNSINLLDAENNYIAGQTFNAKEIREAFLRFFVASFIDYEDYFVDITKKEKEGSNGRGNSNEPSSSGKRGSIPLEECEFDKKGFANHLQDEFLAHMVESQMFSNFKSEKVDSKNVSMEIRFFDENILAKKNRSKLQLIKSSTPFLSDTKDYLREIYTAPLPSTFGIAENTNYTYPSFPSKLNSTQFGQSIRTAVVLVETPEKRRFQDDQASNYLLNIISATTASDFQSLKKMNKQISDKIKIGSQGSSKRTHLLQEQEGFHSPGKTAALRGVEVKNRYRSLTRGMSSLLVKNGSEDIDESDENLPRDSNIDIPRSTSMPVIGGVNPLSPTALKLHATMEENKFFQLTRQYYYFIMNMIVMIQSNYRRRKVFDYYQRLKRSSCRVQIYYRYYRTRKMKKNVKFMISVKKIQTVYRCYRWYRRYHMIRWLIIRIQSFRRQQRLRRQFLAIKAKVLLIQAIIRGWLKRKKFHNQLREWIVQRREQISLLWMLERTSLYYRALFWKVMNHLSDYLSPSTPRPSILQGNESKKGREKERKKLLLSCLVLGFYDEECRRLYESLGLAVKDSPCFSSTSFHTLSFQEQFERVNQLPIIRKLQDLTKAFTLVPATDTTAGTATVVKNDANQVKETVVQIDEYLASAFQRSAEWARVYTLSVEQEKKDRELLYSIFQQYEKDGAASTSSSGKKVEDYFNFFQIEKRKRRKRKMTQYIFMNGLSEEYNEVSCTVLFSLLAYHHRKTSSSTTSNASSSMTSFQREQLSLTKTMSLEYKVVESDWLAMKKQQLLTKHCLEVIKACLLSMERLRRNQQQQQQLARREIYYQVPQVPPLSISPASSVRSSPQRPHHLSNHRK